MRICVQWATDPASDFIDVDSREWSSLPKKAMPPEDRKPIHDIDGRVTGFSGSSVSLDGEPGWLNAISIVGTTFFDDRIAVRHREDLGCVEVIAWDPFQRYADIRCFFPELSTFEYKWTEVIDGRTFRHTRSTTGMKQEQTLYTDMPPNKTLITNAGEVSVFPYSDFVLPEEEIIRYGIYQPQDLFEIARSKKAPEPDEWLGKVL